MTSSRISSMLVSALIALISAGTLGYSLGKNAGDRQIAQLQASHAQAMQTASDDAIKKLTDATARADQLTRQLSAANRKATQLTESKKHDIQQVTYGDTCLNDAALRVLDTAPGLRVSSASGLPLGADVAHIATDTHLGSWAVSAGNQYAECARRLDTLIDWHAGGAP